MRAHLNLALVFLLPCLGGDPAAGADAATAPWSPGETLRFKITFGPLPAGAATLRADGPVTAAGHRCWRLSAEVVTGDLVSSLYRVNDRLESLADSIDLRCHRSRLSICEGGYHERLDVAFDHETGLATDPRGRRVAVPAGCHDVLAAWYRARALPLAVGDSLSLPVLAGHRVAYLHLAVTGREPVPTAWGPRACLVIDATLGGLAPQRAGRETRLWVSDDVCHLPLRLEVAAPVGRFVATLLPENESPPCAASPPSSPSPSAPSSSSSSP